MDRLRERRMRNLQFTGWMFLFTLGLVLSQKGIMPVSAGGIKSSFNKFGIASARFPLTPSLSLGERENRRPSSGENRRFIIVQGRPCLLPLPAGEGRGEGETAANYGDAKNRFAPTVGSSPPPPPARSKAVAPDLKQPPIELAPDLRLRRVGEGAYVITHTFPWSCNSVLVEMADGALVLAGTPCTPEATQAVLAWAGRQFGKRKIVALNTGYHVDNLGGNQALLDAGIPVYGSDLTVKLLKERGEQTRLTTLKLTGGTNSPTYAAHATMKYVPPDHVFPIQDGLKLTFGTEEVQVIYPGPTQAPDKVAVYFPARKLLFGGCMILAGNQPGNTAEADLKQWPAGIRQLAPLPVDVVVPGHGERLDPGLVQHTLKLLDK